MTALGDEPEVLAILHSLLNRNPFQMRVLLELLVCFTVLRQIRVRHPLQLLVLVHQDLADPDVQCHGTQQRCHADACRNTVAWSPAALPDE